jgi:hypothetical protein
MAGVRGFQIYTHRGSICLLYHSLIRQIENERNLQIIKQKQKRSGLYEISTAEVNLKNLFTPRIASRDIPSLHGSIVCDNAALCFQHEPVGIRGGSAPICSSEYLSISNFLHLVFSFVVW